MKEIFFEDLKSKIAFKCDSHPCTEGGRVAGKYYTHVY